MFLVDGFVAGICVSMMGGARAELFEPLQPRARRGAQDEAGHLEVFLAELVVALGEQLRTRAIPICRPSCHVLRCDALDPTQ